MMPLRFPASSLAAALAAIGLSACATTRFIEPTSIELGHAPGPRATALGEDGYLQVQVSSNLGGDAERLKFYGSDAPKLIVVTAKLQPNSGPGRDQPAPEVPLLSYDVEKASSEDLTARTLASGIVVKAGSLTGVATLSLIVRGVTASGAATLGPLLETIKKTPAAITGIATVLGGVPITAFQTFVVPMLEKSATDANHQWQKKTEYTFQVGDRLDSLDGRVVAFLLLTDDRHEPLNAELCSLEPERPRLCLTQNGVSQPLTTPYLLFDLRVTDYRPIDDLVPQGGPCSTDRVTLSKTAETIASGALTGRQAFLEDLLLRRRIVLAEVHESSGSIDRISRAAWHYERLTVPAAPDARYAYWQQHIAQRNQRVDECLNDALAAASLSTRRSWNTLLDGYRAIDEVDTAVRRNTVATEAPGADEAAAIEVALRRLNTAEAVPAIDAESRAYLVAGISNASDLLERYYRDVVARIGTPPATTVSAVARLKILLGGTRCKSCVGILNTALSSLQSGSGLPGVDASSRRENLVIDAVKTGARVDAANSLSADRPEAGNSSAIVQDAVNKSLEVRPGGAGAGSAIDALHEHVDQQRENADSTLEKSAPPSSSPLSGTTNEAAESR